jgi:hypothetical protein
MKKDHLIERYIYDVTRRLPESSRAEVTKELQANIDDMLSEKPTDEEIEKVLLELGDPRILANEYRGTKRYLIGSEWMDDYLEFLKYVLIICGSISLVFGLLDSLKAPESSGLFLTILEVFGEVLARVFGSLCQGFAIITLIFAGLTAWTQKGGKQIWTIKCLPPLPEKQTIKFSKGGVIAELIVTLVFGITWIYVLINNATMIGWYNDMDGWHLLAPLFTASVITPLIPLFVLSLALSLVSGMVKLGSGHWNFWVAGIHTLEQVFSIIVMFVFIGQTGLFHQDFIQLAADQLEQTPAEFLSSLTAGIKGFFTFLTVVIGIDIIVGWTKAFKGQKQVK